MIIERYLELLGGFVSFNRSVAAFLVPVEHLKHAEIRELYSESETLLCLVFKIPLNHWFSIFMYKLLLYCLIKIKECLVIIYLLSKLLKNVHFVILLLIRLLKADPEGMQKHNRYNTATVKRLYFWQQLVLF